MSNAAVTESDLAARLAKIRESQAAEIVAHQIETCEIVENDIIERIVRSIEEFSAALTSPVRRDTCDAIVKIIRERVF